MAVSIVVPVLNEAPRIRAFLKGLRLAAPDAEIIVVDGGSSDGTVQFCRGWADQVLQTPPGRARQMNAGAQIARGDILWFVHADSGVSVHSFLALQDCLRDPRIAGGCFRLQIVPSRWIYRVRDAIGNVCVDLFRVGLGDRGLFCRRENFFAVDGFPDQPLLEDAAFYRRLGKIGRVKQVSVTLQTSARRYEALGPIRTSLFYALIMILYLARIRLSTLEAMMRWYSSRQAKSPGADPGAASAARLHLSGR